MKKNKSDFKVDLQLDGTMALLQSKELLLSEKCSNVPTKKLSVALLFSLL